MEDTVLFENSKLLSKELEDLPNKYERGELLYRNIFTVRCSFEGAEETEQHSLISFYAKKDE